jgi:hypothetical protein
VCVREGERERGEKESYLTEVNQKGKEVFVV